ncbi:MAG: hypothetical protein IKE73_04835, partial [Bacilli bacterium]|nr:hypothetical protein [Bacilli bacterium]
MKKKIIAFLLFNITFLFGSNVVFAATNSTILRKNPYQKVNYKNTWTATDQGDWEANAYYTDNKSSSHITGSKGSNAYCIFPSGKSGVGNGKSVTATEVTNNSSFHKIVKLLYYGYGGPKWNKSGDTLSQRIKGYYDAVCSAYRTDASGRHYAFENGVCDDDDYYFITHIALSYFASKLPDSSYRVPDETDVFYILNWVTEDQIKSSSLTQDPYNTITISDSDFHVWYYEQGSGYQNFVYWTYGDEPTPPSTGTLKVQKNFSGGSSSDSAQDLSTNTYAFYLFDSTCTTKVKERQFTDSSGIATFTNLELNKNYCLVEATDNFDGTQAALPSVTDPGESIYCRRNDTDDCYIARAYEPDVFRKPVQFTTSGQTVNYTNKKEATYCASVTKLGVNGLTFGSATFGVYSNSSCSGSPTETFTLSSSSPTKTWSGLSSSTSKYIKETSAPSGFVLDNTCHEITAKSSCTPDFVTNYPYYLTFAKTDENGNAMANAKFKVKNSSGTVIKVSAKSNQYNGCYLYDTSGTIEEMETDSTGRICIIKIPSGTYSAEETATGNSSYPLPSSTSDRTLTGITTSTSVQTFANAKKFKNTPYLINFYKVDEENNPKGGATFKIKNSSGQYITHSGTSSTGGYRGCYIYSGTNSTGSNFVSATSSSNLDVNVGEVCVIKVPSGTYSAEETSISDTAYYVDQNNKTITGITAGTSKSSFANAKKLKNYPYYLSFYKKDEDGNFMEGAEFKLKVGSTLSNTYVTTSGTDSKGCYIYSGTGDTGSKFTTDSNGRVCISRVSIQNSYYTYEVSTGNTSYAVVTTSKTISRSTSILDSTTNNTVINKPYLINFYKVNEENNSMSGSTFKIKTSGNKYLKYKKSNNNPVYSSTSGYIGCYIYDGEDNTGDIFTTSSSSNNNGVSIGEICVIRVKNETYSAIEQSSGSNQYYLDPNNNTITGITATTSLTAKENAKKLTNYPYIIQMWKSKEDKSNYLSEASFRVYYLDGTTKHYLNSNGVSDVTGYKGCYKYSGETTVENNSSAFITSRVASGNISADEICIIGIPNVTDRKYYAFEYQSNDVKYSTQAKSLGSNTDLEMAGPNSTKQVKSDNYTFLNTPYLINFFKTDENGNNGANDPGFSSNFKVYDNNNKYVIVETNVNNEPIKSNVNEYKGCYIYKSSTTNASSASVLTSNSLENLPIRKGEICIIRIPQKNSYEDNDTLTYTAIEVESNNSSYFVPTNNRIVGLTPSTVFNDKTSNNSIKNRPYLLNFFKVNEDGEANEVLLNGAEFSIRNSNGTTIGYKGTESYTDEDNHTKTCYIYSTANDATYTFISGENGNAGEVCLVRVPKTNNGEELSYTITETDPAKYHTFGNYKTITLKTTKNFQSKLPLSSTDKNKFINYPTEFEFTKNVGRTKGKGINVEGSETITVNGEIVTLDSLTLSELKNLVFNITVSGSTTNLSFIKTGDGVYEYAQDPNMDRPNGEITTNLKVGSNKKIKVLHLPEGTYEIKENNAGTCESATDYTKCIGY